MVKLLIAHGGDVNARSLINNWRARSPASRACRRDPRAA